MVLIDQQPKLESIEEDKECQQVVKKQTVLLHVLDGANQQTSPCSEPQDNLGNYKLVNDGKLCVIKGAEVSNAGEDRDGKINKPNEDDPSVKQDAQQDAKQELNQTDSAVGNLKARAKQEEQDAEDTKLNKVERIQTVLIKYNVQEEEKQDNANISEKVKDNSDKLSAPLPGLVSASIEEKYIKNEEVCEVEEHTNSIKDAEDIVSQVDTGKLSNSKETKKTEEHHDSNLTAGLPKKRSRKRRQRKRKSFYSKSTMFDASRILVVRLEKMQFTESILTTSSGDKTLVSDVAKVCVETDKVSEHSDATSDQRDDSSDASASNIASDPNGKQVDEADDIQVYSKPSQLPKSLLSSTLTEEKPDAISITSAIKEINLDVDASEPKENPAGQGVEKTPHEIFETDASSTKLVCSSTTKGVTKKYITRVRKASRNYRKKVKQFNVVIRKLMQKAAKPVKCQSKSKVTKSPQKTLFCEICCLQFTCFRRYWNHKSLLHHDHCFNCLLCDKKFKKTSALLHHTKFKHKELSADSVDEKGDPIFYCEACGLGFRNIQKRVAHIKTKHKDGYVFCSMCNHASSSVDDLVFHASQHKDLGNTLYICKVCGQNVYFLPMFVNHLHSHTNISSPKKFKCRANSCKYVISGFSNYVNHLERHLFNTLKRLCFLCDRSFASNKKLEWHMKYCHENQFLSHTSFLRLKDPKLSGGDDLKDCYWCGKIVHSNRIKIHNKKHLKVFMAAKKKQITCRVCLKNVAAVSYKNHLFVHLTNTSVSTKSISTGKCKQLSIDLIKLETAKGEVIAEVKKPIETAKLPSKSTNVGSEKSQVKTNDYQKRDNDSGEFKKPALPPPRVVSKSNEITVVSKKDKTSPLSKSVKKTLETKPLEAKQLDVKPLKNKASESKPLEAKSLVTKPLETKLLKTNSQESKVPKLNEVNKPEPQKQVSAKLNEFIRKFNEAELKKQQDKKKMMKPRFGQNKPWLNSNNAGPHQQFPPPQFGPPQQFPPNMQFPPSQQQFGPPSSQQFGPPQQFVGPPQPQFGEPQQPQFGGPPQSQFGEPPQPQFGGPPQPQFGGPPQPQFGGPSEQFMPPQQFAPPNQGFGPIDQSHPNQFPDQRFVQPGFDGPPGVEIEEDRFANPYLQNNAPFGSPMNDSAQMGSGGPINPGGPMNPGINPMGPDSMSINQGFNMQMYPQNMNQPIFGQPFNNDGMGGSEQFYPPYGNQFQPGQGGMEGYQGMPYVDPNQFNYGDQSMGGYQQFSQSMSQWTGPQVEQGPKIRKHSNVSKDNTVCSGCQKKFGTPNVLSVHALFCLKLVDQLSKKSWHDCPVCAQKFVTLATIKQHMFQSHAQIFKQFNLISGNSTAINVKDECKTCKQVFKSKGELAAHEMTHEFLASLKSDLDKVDVNTTLLGKGTSGLKVDTAKKNETVTSTTARKSRFDQTTRTPKLAVQSSATKPGSLPSSSIGKSALDILVDQQLKDTLKKTEAIQKASQAEQNKLLEDMRSPDYKTKLEQQKKKLKINLLYFQKQKLEQEKQARGLEILKAEQELKRIQKELLESQKTPDASVETIDLTARKRKDKSVKSGRRSRSRSPISKKRKGIDKKSRRASRSRSRERKRRSVSPRAKAYSDTRGRKLSNVNVGRRISPAAKSVQSGSKSIDRLIRRRSNSPQDTLPYSGGRQSRKLNLKPGEEMGAYRCKKCATLFTNYRDFIRHNEMHEDDDDAEENYLTLLDPSIASVNTKTTAYDAGSKTPHNPYFEDVDSDEDYATTQAKVGSSKSTYLQREAKHKPEDDIFRSSDFGSTYLQKQQGSAAYYQLDQHSGPGYSEHDKTYQKVAPFGASSSSTSASQGSLMTAYAHLQKRPTYAPSVVVRVKCQVCSQEFPNQEHHDYHACPGPF